MAIKRSKTWQHPEPLEEWRSWSEKHLQDHEDESSLRILDFTHARLSGVHQNVDTTDSPTFVGLTLSGLTVSKPVFTSAAKALTSSGTLGTDQGGTGLTTLGAANTVLGVNTAASALVYKVQTINVKDYGATGDGTTDDSAAFTSAIAAANFIIVPAGTYVCDSMIELTSGKHLHLVAGATLKRRSAASSTDPIVWLKGDGASLTGEDFYNSYIYTEKVCPKGIIRIGHKDMTESHDHVRRCTLRNLRIKGSTAGGQTSGDPDIAVYMPSPELGGKTSYYHDVRSLTLSSVNYGIVLQGAMNGNHIATIQGIAIGNVASGNNAFIYLRGCSDNSFSQCMFSGSTDSIGLLLDDYDNTGNGGSYHHLYANAGYGLIFEPGGTAEKGIQSIIATGNGHWEIIDNCSTAPSLPTNWCEKNYLTVLGTVTYDQVRTSVYLNAAQDNLTDDTWTTVNLDTENFDVGDNFNTGTYTFTAPVNGYYSINAQIGFKNLISGNSGVQYARLYKNGTTTLKLAYKMSGGGGNTSQGIFNSVQIQGIVYLASTDTLILQAMVDNGVNTIDLVNTAAETFMDIILVSKAI